MKKTLILFATALVACVACNKEIETPVSKDLVTISAIAPDSKTTVDGLQVEWTTGDQVALFQTSGDPVLFTLEGEGPVTNGKFSTDTPVTAPNGLAAYPGEGATMSGSKISVVIPSTFAYGEEPIPMVGVSTGGTTFNFGFACGAIRINIKDVPPYPCSLAVISDQNITGTLEIPNYANPSNAAFASEGAGKMIVVTGIPKGNASVTIPLPPGTHSLQVALVANADGSTIVPRSNKKKTSVVIEAAKIALLKQIDLEEGSKATFKKTNEGAFSMYALPGTWTVYKQDGIIADINHGTKKGGLVVFGGGGYGNDYPAFVHVDNKYWCWTKVNQSYKYEYDNELTINVTSLSPVTGTFTWSAGADGKFWDYKWNHTNANYQAFNGTDLSDYYDRIPKGAHSASLDLNTWDVTFDTGVKAHVLAAGEYTYSDATQTTEFNRKLTVPDNCFALMFHIGNHMPQTSWNEKDIDRFIFCPLEYIIIFEKKS